MNSPVQVAGKSAYDILQVDPGASAEVVRTAYRARVKEAHPDLGGTVEHLREVRDAFQRIQEDPDAAAARPARAHAEVLPRRRLYWQVSIFAALLAAAVVTVLWQVPLVGASLTMAALLAAAWILVAYWYAYGRPQVARWMLAKVPRPWRRS